MKTIFFHAIILCLLVSCSPNKPASREVANVKDSLARAADSLLTDETETFKEYELHYVVSVASGYNYDSLRIIALEASKILNYKFDTLDRYYNRTRKKIMLPDNYEDEVWAGEYYFRRFGDAIVSIEMSHAYSDTLTDKNEEAKTKFYNDSLKMFVFADLFIEKRRADSLLNILKPRFGNASLIASEIFMGCMH